MTSSNLLEINRPKERIFGTIIAKTLTDVADAADNDWRNSLEAIKRKRKGVECACCASNIRAVCGARAIKPFPPKSCRQQKRGAKHVRLAYGDVGCAGGTYSGLVWKEDTGT